MTIINGYKIKKENWYTFALDELDIQEKLKNNDWKESDCTIIPCRYINGSKRFAPIEITENKIQPIRSCFSNARISISENKNKEWQSPEFFLWNKIIEAGKSYMVGREISTKDFLSKHTSSMSDWQILGHEWAVENPDKCLDITTTGKKVFTWRVYLEGDHVVLSLPHHGEGGEKDYVSHIDKPKQKVLVNVD